MCLQFQVTLAADPDDKRRAELTSKSLIVAEAPEPAMSPTKSLPDLDNSANDTASFSPDGAASAPYNAARRNSDHDTGRIFPKFFGGALSSPISRVKSVPSFNEKFPGNRAPLSRALFPAAVSQRGSRRGPCVHFLAR